MGVKTRSYYVSRIARVIEGCLYSSLRPSDDDFCESEYRYRVSYLMFVYTHYGIDVLLGFLEADMIAGLYDIPIKLWDKIIDYDYLLHRC